MIGFLRARLLACTAALALFGGILGAMAVTAQPASALNSTQTVIISAQPSFGADPTETVTLIVQVSVPGGGPTPTGNVDFSAEVKGQQGTLQSLGSPQALDSNGQVVFQIPPGTLAPQEYELFASYEGDGVDAPSTGDTPYYIMSTCNLGLFDPSTQGVPIVHPDDTEGYYIGQSNGEWQLFTAKPDFTGTHHKGGDIFSGTITTDGRFVNVASVRNESQDRVTETSPNLIRFRLHTHLSVDEISFFSVCGSTVTFNLSINGVPATTTQIFLGNPASNPATSPFSETR
jgi:hypothetical protein